MVHTDMVMPPSLFSGVCLPPSRMPWLRRLSSRMCVFLNTAAVMMWRARVRIVVAYHGAHCRDMPWRAMRCRAMMCHAVPCYVAPCIAVLCAYHGAPCCIHSGAPCCCTLLHAGHGASWRTMLFAHRGVLWCAVACHGVL